MSLDYVQCNAIWPRFFFTWDTVWVSVPLLWSFPCSGPDHVNEVFISWLQLLTWV